LYISYSAVSIMVSVSHFKIQQCDFIVAIQCSAGNLVEYILTNLAPRECVWVIMLIAVDKSLSVWRFSIIKLGSIKPLFYATCTK
jgi:hypothetical protein